MKMLDLKSIELNKSIVTVKCGTNLSAIEDDEICNTIIEITPHQ